MNDDLKELLALLKSHHVEYLVIGAHAVGFYGRPRMTEDLDLWVGRTEVNAWRLKAALDDFGAPIGEEGARRFAEEDRQLIRLGAPPNMVDILNFAGERPFSEVYSRRKAGDLDEIPVEFPDVEDLIEMKISAGRPQDVADVASLRKASSKLP